MVPEITLMEYLTQPLVTLKDRPDFSVAAFNMAIRMSEMTSSELEERMARAEGVI